MEELVQVLRVSGDVKEVFQSFRNLAKRFEGWTVKQLLRYIKIVEAEKMQFGGEEDGKRQS